MNIPFTFPVSLEDFTAFQEQHSGLPLSDNVREAFAVWVPIFNDSFHDGQAGDSESLVRSLERADRRLQSPDTSPTFAKFLRFVKFWITYAWKQGNNRFMTR